MPDNRNDNRVLNRMGARQLNNDEMDNVSGGIVPTLASDIITGPISNPDSMLDT